MIHLVFHIFLLKLYKEKKNKQQLLFLKIINRQVLYKENFKSEKYL